MKTDKQTLSKGLALTLIGAIGWGFSGTCGQYLMNNKNIPTIDIVNLRLLFGGFILIVISLFKNKRKTFDIFKNKKDTITLILFAIFGLLAAQYSYLQSIHYTNAPTGTVLQFLSSILIVVGMCFIEKRLPYKYEIFAIFFAVLGTFALATHFNLNTLVITPLGLFWGLFSAFAVVIYTILPVNILKKYSSIVVSGFGMLLDGIILSIILHPWTFDIIHDNMTLLAIIGMIVIGSVIAFTAFLAGVSIIGPVKGSLISGTEAIASLLFSIILLGDKFNPIDIIGMVLILIGVSALSLKK